MKKKLLALGLALALSVGLGVPALAAEVSVRGEIVYENLARPTNDKLTVNGIEQSATVYKIDGSNYFKIRDVAAVLNGTGKQFAVGYSGGKVTVTSGQPYEATGKELAGRPVRIRGALPSNDTILIDGEEVELTVYKIGGSNYFKLRELGKALDFYVGWSSVEGVFINTAIPYDYDEYYYDDYYDGYYDDYYDGYYDYYYDYYG